MSGNCSCIRNVNQYQFFEMLKSKLIKVNIIVDFEPEKVLFNSIEWPIFFLHMEACLELNNCNIDWNTKTDIGADNRPHQPFCIPLKMAAKADDIGFRQLPAVPVKITIGYGDFDTVRLFAEFVFILVVVIVIWFFQHTLKHFVFPGMIAEIDRITVIILKKSFDVWLYRNSYVEFHSDWISMVLDY